MDRKIYGFIFFIALLLYFLFPTLRTNIMKSEDRFNINSEHPNFVFILTDDQDSVLGSLNVMKNIEKLLLKRGITFSQAFVASPLCCPSRSSILTGQYVHNHKAINNSISGGCSSPSWQIGPERETFVAHLHNHGYKTFFAGKYLNQYGKFGTTSHVPLGWDWWYGLVGNSRYYNYTLSINGREKYHGSEPEDYLTNVIRTNGIEFIKEAATKASPFFAMFSTPACHAPFEAEPKYIDVFKGSKAPRIPNFNIANDKSKHWLLRLGVQPLPNEIISKVDDIYGKRLSTLLTVDDMVGDIYETIEQNNLLNSTYFIFASDNGYHLGQFSMPLDKREPYEFDIKVPLIISGPSILPGVLEYPVSSIDIAPTILSLAGISIPKTFDGLSLTDMLIFDQNSLNKTEQSNKMLKHRNFVLVEHSGEGIESNKGCEYLGSELGGCNPNFGCKCEDSRNNTYACLRNVSKRGNFIYCAWDDGENFEEYYDISLDPFQLNNTVRSLNSIHKYKLKLLLKEFQKCRADYCRKLSTFII